MMSDYLQELRELAWMGVGLAVVAIVYAVLLALVVNVLGWLM